MLDIGVGLRLCRTSSCLAEDDYINHDVIKPGPAFRVGLAYRFVPYVAVGIDANFSLHGIGYRYEEVSAAALYSWSVIPTLMAYPLSFSRFDPYVGIGLGYGQDLKETYHAGGGLSYADRLSRGQLKLSLGADIYLTERWSLGPRFDWERGIAGTKCAETRGRHDDEICDDIRNYDEDVLPQFRDPVGNGPGRNFWSFGFSVKGHFL